jgi:hypothetical protein
VAAPMQFDRIAANILSRVANQKACPLTTALLPPEQYSHSALCFKLILMVSVLVFNAFIFYKVTVQSAVITCVDLPIYLPFFFFFQTRTSE